MTLNGAPTSRTHNQQNEVAAVGSSNLAFDKNGNTTTDDQGHTLIFDAWDRLVKVKNGSTTLEGYSVDGLGRRITENSGTLRDIYFSKDWQVVEEDVSGSVQDQYVWSPVYVDAMIERDTPTQRLYVQQDANWNVTALVNTSGSVLERYMYDPYAALTYLTASWGSLSGSAYGWQYLFQGGRLDLATGLFNFRHRDYSPTLGRWLESDPIRFGSGECNLYRSENNQPTEATDPDGLRGVKMQAPLPPPPGLQPSPLPSQTNSYGGDGFFSSIGNSFYSAYLGLKGTIQVGLGSLPQGWPGQNWGSNNAAGTFGEAYGRGPLGQTQNSSGIYYWGTRGAFGVAVAAMGAAGISWIVGFNPWIGTAGLHGPHHGLGYHFEIIIRWAAGKNWKVIIPGKNGWIWGGLK